MQAEDGASLISSTPDSSPRSSDSPRVTGESAAASSRRPILRPALTAVMLALAAAVWALDQLTKQWALSRFTPGAAEPFLGHLLQFTLVFNPGAAFSLGTAFTPVITCIMAAVALGLLVASTRVGSRWWAMAAGFLLGGALGNLTDRLMRPPGFAHGHVVDFLMLPNFPVFNIADSFITTAAACIFVAAIKDIPFGGKPPRTHGDETRCDETSGDRTPDGATHGDETRGDATHDGTTHDGTTTTEPTTSEERDRG